MYLTAMDTQLDIYHLNIFLMQYIQHLQKLDNLEYNQPLTLFVDCHMQFVYNHPYDNIQIKNVTLYNSYAGINLTNGGRWRVESIQGNPLYVGLKCDANYDVCYLNRVHFWNFYTQSGILFNWVLGILAHGGKGKN
jgi:hypothetical protein